MPTGGGYAGRPLLGAATAAAIQALRLIPFIEADGSAVSPRAAASAA
jgi:hypothetical protein